MKQIFKIIFFVSLMLSFNFANMIKDDKTTLQDQNLTKQVDELYKAIMADDYDKVKAMLDKNPKLVNLGNSNGIAAIPYLLSIEKHRLNLEIINLLIRKETDLSTKGLKEALAYIIAFNSYQDENLSIELTKKLILEGVDLRLLESQNLFNLLKIAYNFDNYELFKIYLKNGVDGRKFDISGSLIADILIIIDENGYSFDIKQPVSKELLEFVKSNEYKNLTYKKIRYLKELSKYYEIKDINNIEFILKFAEKINDKNILKIIKNENL
ncbi:hypothetical protein [Campylobacter ureolyticus]|uniref:hypothetical protein n=1 Tax=Campylobacter ureolyticus TaxID=827 RepID=UPI0022B462C7|nr:hypothetical protein [Campylobacter ureolyticus]MCZ6167187.1 hypothetical protein [Campylobacter ureolyticus]MCZ6173929.1 hypothetical protein [Campylobacter ureolyticus]